MVSCVRLLYRYCVELRTFDWEATRLVLAPTRNVGLAGIVCGVKAPVAAGDDDGCLEPIRGAVLDIG